jgi:hypothetical protein
MANDINLWLQGHLSTNDYAKVSSVESVWMSDGAAYVRIPGSYVDGKNIYYKNNDGELFGVGDVGSDANSYMQGGTYSNYLSYGIIDSGYNTEILCADKVTDGNTSTVCILPSNQVDGFINNYSYNNVYTVKDNELTYIDDLGTCITRIFTVGKTAFDVSSLNNQDGKCILNSWNLGEGNTEFNDGSDEFNKDGITPIIGDIRDIAFKEITVDHIPPGYDIGTMEDAWNYPDIMHGLTHSTVYDYSNFRLYSGRSFVHDYAGYPVIGELKDTLSGVYHKEDGAVYFDPSYAPSPFLHQPMLLVNRVGNTVTIVHAPDIIAYSIISFGDDSEPVVMYTNPRAYPSDMPVWHSSNSDGSVYENENLTFESIMYRERDYRGVHTYKTSGTYVISVDMYYLGTAMSGGYGSTALKVTRIHATKEIVVNDDPQDLIYFKIPKEIPHLYVNGYRCPIVNTDNESNTVALNVTGYDFLEYAKIIYSNMYDMAPTISYADEDVLSDGTSYPVYDTDNLLVIAKPSFRVSVCERTDIRKRTADIVHINVSERYELNNADSLATILSVFGQECDTALNNTALLGPQCVGKTYDIRNLLAWSSIYANYYATGEDVNNG